MPKYLINSHILKSGTDPRACAEGAAKQLSKGKIKGIEAKACYCCTNEKRVAFIVEGPNQHDVLETIQEQINSPVDEIFEVEEVTPKK